MTAAAASSGNAVRLAARPVAGGGTPAADWTARDRAFPELSLHDCPGLLLVGPHPDDETLGFGATAATLHSRGVDVRVVSVSDGGGAYLNLSPLERTWLERPADPNYCAQQAISVLPASSVWGCPTARCAITRPAWQTR